MPLLGVGIICVVDSIAKQEPTSELNRVSEAQNREQPEALDWIVLRSKHAAVTQSVEIDGFLHFAGHGDYPTATLWATDEGLRQKRPFHHIALNSEQVGKIVIRGFGGGADQWRSLEGAYVIVQGEIETEDSGFNYINLGRMKTVTRIVVANNGWPVKNLE